MKETSLAKKSYVGLKKKVHGDLFESLVVFFAKNDKLPIIKIPEGCRTVKGKLVRIKSPFDFLLNAKTISVFFDAKTTIKKHFTYSSVNQDQLVNLLLVNNPTNLSGYVICFDSEVGFAPVEVLARMKPGASITIAECIHLGNVKSFSFKKLAELGEIYVQR